MTIANVSQGSACGLPKALRTAQEAIDFPEVQEMLRRLSEYKLGILPHMHDEQTGEFQPLPDEIMQVEFGSGSVLPTSGRNRPSDRSLSRGGMVLACRCMTPMAVCEMVWEEAQGDTDKKHRMFKGN